MCLLIMLLNPQKLFIQNNLPLSCLYSWDYINFLAFFCLIILYHKLNIFFIKNQPLFFNSFFLILGRPWINFDNFRITIAGYDWHRIRCVDKPVFYFKQILFQRRYWSRLLYFNLFCFWNDCLIYNINNLKPFLLNFYWWFFCFLIWKISKYKSLFFVFCFAYFFGFKMFLVFDFISFHFLFVKKNTLFLR